MDNLTDKLPVTEYIATLQAKPLTIQTNLEIKILTGLLKHFENCYNLQSEP